MPSKLLNALNEFILFSLKFDCVFLNKNDSTFTKTHYRLQKIYLPVVILINGSLIISATAKLVQLNKEKNYEKLLDSAQMYMILTYAIVLAMALRQVASSFKECIDQIGTKFVTSNFVNFKDLFVVLTMALTTAPTGVNYIINCFYYQQTLLALWVPFVDNTKEFSTGVYLIAWAWQSIAILYGFLCLIILSPFVVVCSVCVQKELDYLNKFASEHFTEQAFVTDSRDRDPKELLRRFVEHDILIRGVLGHVERLHRIVFLIQTLLLVVYNCVLAFYLYHTKHILMVSLKNGPVLLATSNIMFVYCKNGQQITNRYEQLRLTIYSWPWDSWSVSCKTSFKIVMEMYKKPVRLTAMGIFPASYPSFLKCVEQSLSYLLFLKAVTPDESTM